MEFIQLEVSNVFLCTAHCGPRAPTNRVLASLPFVYRQNGRSSDQFGNDTRSAQGALILIFVSSLENNYSYKLVAAQILYSSGLESAHPARTLA